jgi:drug/metabolite transporter (DMT)-like permease
LAAVLLALGSSVCWGSADFLGGISSRRIPVAVVLFGSQLPALVLAATWALAAGDPPAVWRLAVAVGAGCAGVIALGAFYRALAMGTMSIVAPISGTGAIVPVVAGVASGGTPSALQAAGIVAAVIGVVLASREQHEDAARAVDARRAVGLALVAALGFGAFLTLMEPAAKEGVPWALTGARAGSVTLLLAFVAFRHVDVRAALTPRLAPTVLAVGVLDLGANALYAAATRQGLLAVVSVLGSLYPVATVLLARAFLAERVRRSQEIGVVAVLAGVALIAAG